MANALFGYGNLLDLPATVLTCGSQRSNLPVSNLADPDPQRPWVTMGATQDWVHADFGSPQSLRLLGLFGALLTSTAQVRWRLGTAPLFDDPILRQSFTDGSEIDPRFVVARAGATATRFNAAGELETVPANTPRVDYGWYTLTDAGGQDWAATPAPNLLTAPEAFSASPWFGSLSVTSNAGGAPDGTVTADRLAKVSASSGYRSYPFSPSSTAMHAASVYLKVPAGSLPVRLLLVRSSPYVVIAQKTANVTTAWQRFDLVGAPLDLTSHQFVIDGGLLAVGDAFDAWGAKLEVGATATGYQPVTPACRGLLIEPARTNFLLRSTELDHPVWGKTRLSVIANAARAPDGTVSADMLVEDTSVALTHELVQSVSGPGTYCFSALLKAGTRRRAQLVVYNPTDGNMGASTFDLTAGAVVAGSHASAQIKKWADGWYLCSIVITCTAPSQYFLRPDNGSTVYYTGDGVSGFYAWGVQAESGTEPTSRIPTTTAAVTRNADNVTVVLSSVPGWSTAAGTLFADAMIPASGGQTRVLASLNDASTNNRVTLGVNQALTDTVYRISVGGVAYDPAAQPAPGAGAGLRMALAWAAGSASATINGAAPVGSSLVAAPAVTTLEIGAQQGGLQLTGYIRRIALYSKRLSNAQLQSLTGPDQTAIVADVLDTGWTDAKVAEGYWSTLHLLGSTVAARYLRVDIDDPGRATETVNGQAPGDLIVGRMVAMPVEQPLRNFSYPVNERFVPMDTKQRGRRSGAVSVDPGPSYREISFGYEALGQEDARGTFKEFLRRVGIREQLVFIPDPGSIYQPTEAILGRRAESTPMTWANFAMWSHQMTIEEDPALGA
ncbi:hypothetical protein GBZ26_11275 [Azospirillum formosense]|uniref:Concanavalin A-like lectin/glucanase superfamily protein n=1 Tax=Azospirillum formosense TaxID=861533 RepID=A0ABX2KWS7_9PROT|nr:hypothetical protein [Azospirillum formosense]MBY3756712.1 hypothetical protein [Azospirillum formosense]NUB19792.1 hypothetical protein [Azospirillum formosense]